MKNVSARATFSEKAKSLFSSKETSREIANRVLESRSASRSTMSGKFVVSGHPMRTERLSTLKSNKKTIGKK